jgi:hypothetical protein
VTREVSIGGEGCRLILSVSGYQFPEAEDSDDANWLGASVEVSAGTTGRFAGAYAGFLRCDDLARFRDELRVVLESLDGRATFHDLESRVGADIQLTRGRGVLEVFVREDIGARLEVTADTDQTYLAETLGDLDQLLAEFPVRGRR